MVDRNQLKLATGLPHKDIAIVPVAVQNSDVQDGDFLNLLLWKPLNSVVSNYPLACDKLLQRPVLGDLIVRCCVFLQRRNRIT